jgi:hypothetical protein
MPLPIPQVRYRRSAILLLLLTMAMMAMAPLASGQAVEDISGAPVDIHSGTCQEPVLEPVFDAGELGADTIEGIQDEKSPTDGLIVDQAAGARGVDLDGDGALAENEIIGGADTDAPLAWADFESEEPVIEAGVDEPLVVIVHADADAGYSTFIACGSLTDAQPNDEGRRIVPLAPQGDYTSFGYAVLSEDGQTMTTYMFQPGTVPQATPDPLANAQGPFPVDIHSGTCTDWTTEPIYDMGEMQVTNVWAPGDQEAGDTGGEVPEAAASLGPVYQVNTDETDFDAAQLVEEGEHVIAVHQSAEDYETLVACGNILDFTQDGNLIVPLQPVGESNLTGVTLIGDNGFNAYLWQCEPVEQAAEEQPTVPPAPTPTPTPTTEPSPTPTAEPSPTPTSEPTPTPEPTATEVPTTVIETTEEVLAPTATALAQQEQSQDVIELADESPGALTLTADEPLVFNNTSDTDRVFRVEDLNIEETIPAGEELEVQLPDDTEPGDYPYQILENDEPVFEDTLTVE